jgi:hypothetical protein
MNGYICSHIKKGRVEVYANTSYEAQQKAAVLLKIKKTYEITVFLAEKNEIPVVHTAVD